MTLVSIVDHLPVLPEVLLLVGTCALMIVDLRVKSAERKATFVMAQLVLLACALATLWVLGVLAAAVLFMGIYPLPFTEVMHASVNDLLRHLALPKL